MIVLCMYVNEQLASTNVEKWGKLVLVQHGVHFEATSLDIGMI